MPGNSSTQNATLFYIRRCQCSPTRQAVFGVLHDKTLVQSIDEWCPVDISSFIDHEDQETHPAVHLPFKIGALTLPMLTHNGSYGNSLKASETLSLTVMADTAGQ